MADLAPYPDIEAVLIELLADFGTVGTVTPPNLVAALPFVRVQRFGGSADVIFDDPRVTIDTFGASRSDAYLLAANILQRLVTPQTLRTSAGVVDSASVETGPTEIPWDDRNIRRVSATYSLSTRR